MIIVVFFMIDFIGYKVLSKHMLSDHEKNKKILFYEIKSHTSSLLEGLLVEHSTQKDIMIEKHQLVMEYMNTHDLDVDLDEIYEEINKGHERKPYNIYITDKDLIIQNSTYLNDIGFNLSFAKDIFDKHKKENIIGYSVPVRERTSKNFLTYTDSYLSKNGDEKHAVLQVSYAYEDTTEEFNVLLKLIKQYSLIEEVISYSISSAGHVYEMVMNDSGVADYKPSLKKHLSSKKKAFSLEKRLENHDLLIENFKKDKTFYSLMYMSASYEIDKDVKIIYSVLINESDLYNKLKNLDILLILISLMAIITIFTILKLRSTEVKSSEHDKFIKSAMHEIKTPLSVITLNNELRALEQGKDSYSEEIDNALKVLNHSYNTMSFIVNKDKVKNVIELLSLNEVVKERIDFFQSIADANDKKIISDISGDCKIKMTYPDLIRLIDNNLSNAIKYSPSGSVIKVVIYDNLLSFNNMGKVIENKDKIFSPYVRENTTVGGYGLGLSIIKDITVKFDIDISLLSDKQNGTTFTYFFKCHTDDTQEE